MWPCTAVSRSYTVHVVPLRTVGSHSHFSPSLCRAAATKGQGGNSRPYKQKTVCFMFVLTSEEFSHCSPHQNLSPTLLRPSHSFKRRKDTPFSHISHIKHVLSFIFKLLSYAFIFISCLQETCSFFYCFVISFSIISRVTGILSHEHNESPPYYKNSLFATTWYKLFSLRLINEQV